MKKVYYISYDKQFFDKSLESKIKKMGAWFNFFDNQWLLQSHLPEKEIYNRLQNLQNPIRILILEITIKSSWGWMPQDAWDWLNKVAYKYKFED